MSLLRRSGLSQIDEGTNTKLRCDNGTEDGQAMEVSLLFNVTLYLYNATTDRHSMYNPSGHSKVFVMQTHDTLSTFDGADDGTYTLVDIPTTQAYPSTDVEMSSPSSDIGGHAIEGSSDWTYEITPGNVDRGVHRSNVQRGNITYNEEPSDDLTDTKYDLIIKCPKAKYAFVVEGYSRTCKVTFDTATIHTSKLSTPLLKIPNGLGICLLTKVIDIFVLDEGANPIQHIDLYSDLATFAKGLGSGISKVQVNTPLAGVTDADIIRSDIGSRYTNIRIGREIIDGECVYHFDNNARGGVNDRSTLGYMVNSSTISQALMCIDNQSSLCLSMDTLDKILASIDSYLPEGKSIIYQTVRRFILFLYKMGFLHELVYYDTPEDAFSMYCNIRLAADKLNMHGGDGDIDMEPFQPFYNRTPYVYKFNKWTEVQTGIKLKL